MSLAGDTWPAPAKLNLFLHVTGRREDGYHDLQTLFQLLDWGDEVRIRENRTGVIRKSGPDYGVPDHLDLVIRAAESLKRETGASGGAEIQVRKQIPMGSGLGGGSSDAATVLLVLNQAWGCGLSEDELASLGADLGADVPVFVRGNSAMATGIGAKLEPVSLGERHYVLVFPGFSVSTADVFGDAGLKRDSKAIEVQAAIAGAGRNDCQPVVERRFPEMRDMLGSLEKWGSPRMTGTGSAIFIPMEGKKRAMSAAQQIKSLYNSRAVRGVDRSSVHEKLYTGGT